jgi:DNA-damage-inducible protein J
MKTATYNINIAPEVKNKAEEVFAALGLDLGEAINLFLRSSIRERGLPFDVREKIPNATFQSAIDESDAMVRGDMPLPPRQRVDDIFAELEKELSEQI